MCIASKMREIHVFDNVGHSDIVDDDKKAHNECA